MVLIGLHGVFGIMQLIRYFSYSTENRPTTDLPGVIDLLCFSVGFFIFLGAFEWNCEVTVTTFNSIFRGKLDTRIA